MTEAISILHCLGLLRRFTPRNDTFYHTVVMSSGIGICRDRGGV